MKRIPKSFKLFGHTIKVAVISKTNWGPLIDGITKEEGCSETCVGLFDPATNAIYLVRQPRSQLSHSLWHETTHAILYYLNHKLYSNEQFVDTVAGCIAQVIETAEH